MQYLVWPVVVLILGLAALFLFKQPFSRLIDRTQKVGKLGLETSQTIQTASAQASVSKADELLKIFDNSLLVKQETEIRTWLDKANLPSGGERERVLIRFLAGGALVMLFEKIYSIIWGSQIGALEFLNSSGPTGAELDSLRSWFLQGAANEPQLYAGDTFERWLSFLESYSLIAKAGNNFVITLEGREFLKYIIHQGYTLYKRG